MDYFSSDRHSKANQYNLKPQFQPATWWRQTARNPFMRLYNFFPFSLIPFPSRFFSLTTKAMCSAQSPSHIPSSRIAPRWFTSSLALEGVCLKPSGLWTIASTLISSLLSLFLSHTHHLRSRLLQELKKPIRVLHAGRGVCRCVPSDRNMETWQKERCLIRRTTSEVRNASYMLARHVRNSRR